MAKQRRTPPPYDHRRAFDLARNAQRSMRNLERIYGQTDRINALYDKIEYWLEVQLRHPPETLIHRFAAYRVKTLQATDPDARTFRDELSDFGHTLLWEAKKIGYRLFYVLLLIAIHILWFAFLIFVALPILWDWFWQIPPGFK